VLTTRVVAPVWSHEYRIMDAPGGVRLTKHASRIWSQFLVKMLPRMPGVYTTTGVDVP
jgi:hypothetical protein